MSMNQNPNRKVVVRSGSFFQDLTNRFRLISRLLVDPRVSPLVKILPVATLAYVIVPIDLLPLNPIDDAFVLWVGTTLFVELCPPQVVDEHVQALARRASTGQAQSNVAGQPNADIIDGEYFESDPTGGDPSPR